MTLAISQKALPDLVHDERYQQRQQNCIDKFLARSGIEEHRRKWRLMYLS